MYLETKIESSVVFEDDAYYRQGVTIKAMGLNESNNIVRMVGRIDATRFPFYYGGCCNRAIIDDDRWYLPQIKSALFSKKGRIRRKLAQVADVGSWLVLHRIVFHPDSKPHWQNILRGVLEVFGMDELVLVSYSAIDRSEIVSAMLDVGFKEIRDTNVFYGRSYFDSLHSQKFPTGQTIDAPEMFTGNHEAWVEERITQMVVRDDLEDECRSLERRNKRGG